MSDVLPFRRLRLTPMRDLVRGRVTGRLDWRARVAAASLPAPVAARILAVVERTRLWRLERGDVADELVAHFADGLARGAAADELLRDFGDERVAARLIRRAARRKRPLAWHALKWARRGLVLLVALYAIVLVRFLVGRPTVSIDYVARLNASTEGVPIEDRAWPVYRQAILALGAVDAEARRDATIFKTITDRADGRDRHLYEATPADAEWPELTAWLDAHADGLALLRTAAAKPHFGFILGRNGSQVDPELGWTFKQNDQGLIDRSLITVLLPQLNHMRQLALLLDADRRYALATGDTARVAADFQAMLGLARHLRESAPFLVVSSVGIGIYDLTFDRIERSLVARPELLDDRQLVDLAHRVSRVGGDAASSLIDLSGERMNFHDVVQRMYTDDGSGDGRLTPEGARGIVTLGGYMGTGLIGTKDAPALHKAALMGVSGAASVVASRRELLAEYDRLLDRRESINARPLRESIETENYGRGTHVDEISSSPLLLARYFPLTVMFPSLGRSSEVAERLLARREGVVTGIALELYRRRHGEYPATLDALAPTLLPRVPADRITGEPIRYALVDGKPVVYSVGVDRDDDGGRPWADPKTREPDPRRAATWATDIDASKFEGDWILYDARP